MMINWFYYNNVVVPGKKLLSLLLLLLALVVAWRFISSQKIKEIIIGSLVSVTATRWRLEFSVLFSDLFLLFGQDERLGLSSWSDSLVSVKGLLIFFFKKRERKWWELDAELNVIEYVWWCVILIHTSTYSKHIIIELDGIIEDSFIRLFSNESI